MLSLFFYVAEWPDQKIVAQVVVELSQPQWFDQKKADDECAVECLRKMSQGLDPEREPKPGRCPGNKAVHDARHQQDERRTEIAADNASKPAYDDHCQGLDRDVDRKLFGR